jgi:hypothetical protein
MELARTEDDHCPHCVDRFEIVCVKFRFAHYPTMVVVCPSCAYTTNWGVGRALWRKVTDGHGDDRVLEDGRVSKAAEKLELMITEAVKAAPGCEALISHYRKRGQESKAKRKLAGSIQRFPN